MTRPIAGTIKRTATTRHQSPLSVERPGKMPAQAEPPRLTRAQRREAAAALRAGWPPDMDHVERKGEATLRFFMQLQALHDARPTFDAMCDPMLESFERMQRMVTQRLEAQLDKAQVRLEQAPLQAHFTQLALVGVAPAQYRLAKMLTEDPDANPNQSIAAEWYRKAADNGEVLAQRWMGLYCRSRPEAKDQAQAVAWFGKAARQGDARAALELGDCYFAGTGVTRDWSKALVLYLRAAEQGSADAQFNAAMCYFTGRGSARDPEAGIRWCRLAATNELARAQRKLASCYLAGTGVKADVNSALYWCLRAAINGDPDAQFAIAYCHEKGLGAEPDPAAALRWYSKAGAHPKYGKLLDPGHASSLSDCAQQ
jgi:TPR repeat protein